MPGYESGIVPETWYYAMKDRYDHMQTYYPIKQSFHAREFPTSWRLLNFDVERSIEPGTKATIRG